MKKIILFLALLCAAGTLKAQSLYKPFKVDIALGYAIPTASDNGGTKAGVAFDIHPHYRLNDDLAVGFRFEGAALGYKDNSEDNAHVNVSVLTSYCATGEYYFKPTGLRPFVGAGLGAFIQSASIDSDNGDEEAAAHFSKFGFFPEAGFEAGHFRFSADYDILGENSNYFAFKIGAFFGGGKKYRFLEFR